MTVNKPFAFQAPILNEAPASDDWGQLVRHVGTLTVVGETVTRPATSVVTAVAQSTSSVMLAAANADRRGLCIYNNSNRVVFVCLNTGPATLTNWSVRLGRNDYYELPFPVYTGDVTAIWGSGSGGFARVTEFTS